MTNLLYILSDQHCSSVMGAAGDAAAETPSLDRLAARGTTVTEAYCPSPLCVPSRMSLLTGRHPSEIGVWDLHHGLSPNHPTWAHALGAAGYATRLVGRLHSVGPDQLLGFSARVVGDHGSNYHGGADWDFGPLTGTAGPDAVSLRNSGPGLSPYEVHDHDVTAAGVAAIEELAARSRETGRPFALSVGFMLPHQPYVAQAEDYERFAGRVPPPRYPSPPQHPYLRRWRETTGLTDVQEADVERARTAYYALVYRLDDMVGQLLDALDRSGAADDTLVVYLSDHGDQLGERGLWWKQTFYDESAKIPCIFALPGVVPEGARLDRVVGGVDITATVLDLLGGHALPNASGRSFAPLLRGEPCAWDDLAFAEFCVGDAPMQRMVRRGRWKHVYFGDGLPAQLFDVEADPYELEDVSGEARCAAVMRELHELVLERWDPVAVRRALRATQADAELLERWAQATHPRDAYRWRIEPPMSRLD